MNYKLLFGKNINLNKARQLAFNRDSGLAREIKMQLGGQFDLATENAAQVKALTDGFGLSQEELQKLYKVKIFLIVKLKKEIKDY